MEACVFLSSTKDAVYSNNHHQKLRGVLWSALERVNSKYVKQHDEFVSGFSFSTVYPFGDMRDGDWKYIMISGVQESLIADIVAGLIEMGTIEVGEMRFTVDDYAVEYPQIGSVGEVGYFEPQTGIMLRTEYIDDTTPSGEHYWSEGDDFSVFKRGLEYSILSRHSHVRGEIPTFEHDIFDSYEHIKEYAIPQRIGDTSRPVILQKVRLGYTVQSQQHREVLQTALDLGVGHGTARGFGNVEKNVGEIPSGE